MTDQPTFEYRDEDGDDLIARPMRGIPAVLILTGTNGIAVDLDRVEEVVAGIRDAARTATRQTTGQDDTEPDPTTADDPTPLRWGLGDILHGDDDTVIVCLSGPDREPYWLELDPERAAALRRDLTPPAAEDTIGLCGYCGVPRENHHHGYTSTTDVIAASPYSRTDDEPAPAVGQPVEAHDTAKARARLAALLGYEPDEHDSEFEKALADYRAAVLREGAAAIDAETRTSKADGVLEPDKFRPCRDTSAQLRRMADGSQP